MAAKLRKGDKVVVLTGKDKGKTGEIQSSPTKAISVAMSRPPAEFQLAVIGVRTPRQLAAVVKTGGRAVARQLRELQVRLEALFHGLVFVVRDRLELGALGGILSHQTLALLLAFDHGFLGHISLFLPRISC